MHYNASMRATDPAVEKHKGMLHEYLRMQVGKQSGYWKEWTMQKPST